MSDVLSANRLIAARAPRASGRKLPTGYGLLAGAVVSLGLWAAIAALVVRAF